MLQGTHVNRDGYGAKVVLYHQSDTWTRELNGGSSHASQHSSVLHFGLGTVDQLDSLSVIWPGGKRQSIIDVVADQIIKIAEDEDGYHIAGCMNENASNYNASATYDYGCFIEVAGCLDPTSTSFDLTANVDNGDCAVEEVVTALADNTSDAWVVYPNPMIDHTVISYPNPDQKVLLELLDFSGKILLKTSFHSSHTLTRDHWQSGLYVLRLTSAAGVSTRKLIIQ
jgi:hypothetical protein